MSLIVPQPQPGPRSPDGGEFHVPADAGVTKWVFGDTYTMKLTGQQTGGSLGLVEASVPPGGGPVAHTHAHEDEIFYLLSGELEFLNGEQRYTARPGDVVFVPRTAHHGFRNTGIRPATMLFMYTPGGAENIFIEGGDEPEPGKAAPFWGPERLPQLAELLVKYGIEVIPEP